MNALPSSPRRMSSGIDRIVLGLAVIAFGILALLDNLGAFATPLLHNFWPLALTLWGLSRLLAPRRPGHWVFAVVLIAAGLLMTLHNLGLLTVRLQHWWPLIVILAGVSMLARGSRPGAPDAFVQDRNAAELDSGDLVEVSSRFGTVERRIDSAQFRGGRVDARFSGVELDLSLARMAAPEATLELDAAFSSLELRVPRDWQVDVQLQATLGGIEDRTQPNPAPAHRLILRGESKCGHVEIRN